MAMKKEETIYRKMSLIRPGFIYEQRANVMVLCSMGRGGGGAYIQFTFLFFFQYKARISTFFDNKDTGIRKINDKVKNKDTVKVILASLLITLNIFNFLSQCLYS